MPVSPGLAALPYEDEMDEDIDEDINDMPLATQRHIQRGRDAIRREAVAYFVGQLHNVITAAIESDRGVHDDKTRAAFTDVALWYISGFRHFDGVPLLDELRQRLQDEWDGEGEWAAPTPPQPTDSA